MRSLRNLVKSNNVYQNWSLFGSKAQCSTSTQVLLFIIYYLTIHSKSNFSVRNFYIYSNQQAKQKWPKKIISGIQPTGILHIGNYFGAVQRWVQMQKDGGNVTFFLADLHSMTMPYVFILFLLQS